MFAVEEVVKAQWSRKTRGKPPVVNLSLRDGRGDVSTQVDEAVHALLEAWQSAGNVIEPPPPKRGPEAPETSWLDHPLFAVSGGDDAVLWRYMNFDQFIALLDGGSLWFSRGHVLRQLEPYEGRLPAPIVSMPPYELMKRMFPGLNLPETEAGMFADSHRRIQALFLYNVLINCWHVGEYESNAMWRVYGKSNNSVAIRTTLSRLRASFGAYRGYDLHIGEVTYIDHETDELAPDNCWRPWLHKAKFFASEQEVRCAIFDDGEAGLFGEEEPYCGIGDDDFDHGSLSPGVGVPVDLDTLIPAVFISPNADPWFLGVVEATVARFGLRAATVRSSISIGQSRR